MDAAAWLVLTSVAANAAHVLAPVDPSAWTPQLWAGATISASMPLVLFSSIEVISMIAFSRPAPMDETSVEDEIFEVSVVQEKMRRAVNPTPQVAPAPLPATTVIDVPEPKSVPAHSMTIPAAVSEPMPAPDALPAPAVLPATIVERSPASINVTKQPTKPRKSTKPAPRPASRSAKPVTTVRPMTDEDLPEAIRMTEEGLSRQRVADALGVSKSAVARALTAYEAKAAA